MSPLLSKTNKLAYEDLILALMLDISCERQTKSGIPGTRSRKTFDENKETCLFLLLKASPWRLGHWKADPMVCHLKGLVLKSHVMVSVLAFDNPDSLFLACGDVFPWSLEDVF